MNGKEPQGGFLDYFSYFFRTVQVPYRLVILAYFIVFLITPVYGRPGETSLTQSSSVLLVVLLGLVQIIAILVLALFNRVVPKHLRKAGDRIFIMIVVPFLLFILSSFIVLPLASTFPVIFQVMISIIMIVPLVLVIVVLIESVIQTPFSRGGARLPVELAIVTIFLIIYTFGTLYFINGLVVNSDGGSVSFSDTLYVSGLAFTSLGFTNLGPTGIGEFLAVFESVSGYITIALITTILLRMVLSRRN